MLFDVDTAVLWQLWLPVQLAVLVLPVDHLAGEQRCDMLDVQDCLLLRDVSAMLRWSVDDGPHTLLSPISSFGCMGVSVSVMFRS